MDILIGIVFDLIEKWIYWIDFKFGMVVWFIFDGEMYEVICENVSLLMGIDVDFVGGNVFWINSDKRIIEVLKLNGDYWKVLVYNLYLFLVDIVLDIIRG